MDHETNNPLAHDSGAQLTPASGPVCPGNDTGDETTEPPTKRIKVGPMNTQEGRVEGTPEGKSALAAVRTASASVLQATGSSASTLQPSKTVPTGAVGQSKANAATVKMQQGGSSIVTASSAASNSSNSTASVAQETTHTAAAPVAPAVATKPSTQAGQPVVPSNTPNPMSNHSAPVSTPSSAESAPLKSTMMSHLGTKYLGELEYMLREFRKLERQLLGAKGAAQIEESAGSRERREKLHSFILHLEDTISQIEMGCKLQAEGKSTVEAHSSQANDAVDDAKKQMAEKSALMNLTKEKEEEENVQKLEEHILANLLPVKVRLKKQLAAQQGASRNPVGMPPTRRGSLVAANRGKGTFAAAAEQRRKQAEAARLAAQEQQEQAQRSASDQTQFGKPLKGGGSSLTQKLHGATLGSKQRVHGHGVGTSTQEPATTPTTSPEKKILYAGMVPESTQHQSGVAAATGVHQMVIENPNLMDNLTELRTNLSNSSVAQELSMRQDIAAKSSVLAQARASTVTQSKKVASTLPTSGQEGKERKPSDNPNLTEEERKKLRKERRKRKLKRLSKRREKERQRQLALQQQSHATLKIGGRKKAVAGQGQGKKKGGPRTVEYICALCSEAYNSTCDYNPWWALAQHECPKCRKTQVRAYVFNEFFYGLR